MPDVTIRYNNETIAEMSESGTKVLKTKDTKCEDDIEVEYVKSQTNYTRTLTVNGDDNGDWQLRIPNLVPIIPEGFSADWFGFGSTITVLTGEAENVSAIIESVSGAEGSKTHPYNVTGTCVRKYTNGNGKLILNPNADTFEITIVATNE